MKILGNEFKFKLLILKKTRNMTIKKLFASTLVVLLFFFGCKKDREELIITQEDTHVSDIVGLVLDKTNQPISGAQVEYNDQVAMTDQHGVYEFHNVSVGSQHNFIKISKIGYFDGFRTFRTDKPRTINQLTTLLANTQSSTISSSSEAIIAIVNGSLKFPANAFILPNGDAYNGQVEVKTAYIDPLAFSEMPGDLSAINEQDEFETLSSYGMVTVELKGNGNIDLNIKPGNTVIMETEIPQYLVASAPETIPLWHFNEETGLWEEEGMASKIGSKYIGEVSHFSTWNYDVPNSAAIVSGRLIDTDGEPVKNVIASIKTPEGRLAGSVNTNEDGSFSTRLPANRDLELFLANGECIDPFWGAHLADFGPFTGEMGIGDLVIEKFGEKTLSIEGTLLNCEGQPITNGLIGISGKFFNVTDGKINSLVNYCGNRPTKIFYTLIDRDNNNIVSGDIDVTSNEVSLGQLEACTKVEEFCNYTCANIGLDVYLDEFTLDVFNTQEIHFKAESAAGRLEVGWYWKDTTGNPDTYSIHFEKFYDRIAGKEYLSSGGGSTITVIFDEEANVYTGSVKMLLNVNGQPEQFLGTFQFNGP